MPSSITALLRRYQAQVNKLDADNLRLVSQAYAVHYARLAGDIDALMLAIGGMDNPTSAAVKALPQYKRLIRNAGDELDKFTVYLETTIAAVGASSVALGLLHSQQIVRALAGAKFAGVSPNAMTALLSYLDPAGPLYARLELLTGSAVERVVQAILDGVGLGYNPRKIADGIEGAFGGGLTDALRNTRTVQLWSYRDSTRANYQASGVVDGWIWTAQLDADTCEACVAEHGTIHPLDEQLDGHYNCRCFPAPYIEGVTDEAQTGEEWFAEQDEDAQRALLGPGKYDAWKDGKFEFSQLAQQVPNEVYGTMRQATPLRELIGE